MRSQYEVAAIRVMVPHGLAVSESKPLVPHADIVWRGDPFGDRFAQVLAIVEDAAAKGTAMTVAGRRVGVDLELARVHALTQRARYTVGGNYYMRFAVTVRDAATGEVIDGPRLVVADLKASGGARAIAEEQNGLSERPVVVKRLRAVIRRALSARVDAPTEDTLATRGAIAPAGLSGA